MLDNQVTGQLDQTELEARLREIVVDVCEADAATVESMTLGDLDSFTFVQLVLEVEHQLNVLVLEDLVEFSGRTFEDLAVFILKQSGKAG
ncbi:hypothetical protein E1287_08285 [Actinomadura sp. KC06]|uniref:hypothetical protein n=1 Tax=Actinomadura sp. KC06 TaxID=2530369 RepID=UPI00104FA0B0|nr:hypothetical protein [Actinomadura sp. KC06]TDD37562.1 hypothetical protein E1287_08285 [Actinomadura sp. KC06]